MATDADRKMAAEVDDDRKPSAVNKEAEEAPAEEDRKPSAVSPEPEAVTEGATTRRSQRRQGLEKMEKLYIGVMVLAVLAIALALGLVFGLRDSTETVQAPRGTPAPTTVAESQAPSSAPTGVLDSLLLSLPNSAIESLQSVNTPQWQAFEWLSTHPNVANLTEWRKTQLFALAAFYYAFEGPNWPDVIRNNWLDQTKDECYWFSSEFAGLENSTSIEPCNVEGQFQSLALIGLGLSTLKPFVPPEIALLTALKSFQLSGNSIGAPLSVVIPSELSQLTAFTALSLGNNALSGLIPSEMGLFFSNLRILELSQNSLTGPIPSEIGLLTDFTALSLGSNAFSGTIPTELGMFSNMQILDLSQNSLSGFIPSEIGLLTALEVLDLSENLLTGPVPPELDLLSINDFNVEGNYLSQ